MLVAPRLLQLLMCVATAASSSSIYPRSFQSAWEEENRKRQLPPAFEDRFRRNEEGLKAKEKDLAKQWPRFYGVGRPREVEAALPPAPPRESEDLFRSILKRANGFQDLLHDDSSSLLDNHIALSGQAVREVFANVTNKSRTADMSRIRVHPGNLIPRRRRIGLRRFTRKLIFRPPSTTTPTTTTTTTRRTTKTTTSTANPTTAFSVAFYPSRRRKLFVRLRKVDKNHLIQKLATKGLIHAAVTARTPARTKKTRQDSVRHQETLRHPEPPRRAASHRSVVEEAYALPEVARRPRRSHLSLSDGFLRKRFGTFKDLEVHLVSGGSTTNFEVPDVEAVYKRAAVYKTPMDNSSVELYCLAGYRTAASITWRMNGRTPEEFVSTETAFSKRDGGLKVIISRLKLQRLEVLPTMTGNYSFECVANIDDSDARASIEVTGSFNNTCIDSSDCDARNALCTFGKCECKDFLPVPLNSRHTTCRSFGYIGWPCHYDEQCSYAVQNSVCSAKGRCACLDDYRRNRDNQSCVPRSGLGAECSEQKECDAAHAVCRGGHCRCPEGTSPRAGSCFDLPASPLSERMKDKMFLPANVTVVAPLEDSTMAAPSSNALPAKKASVSSAGSLGETAATARALALFLASLTYSNVFWRMPSTFLYQ
ncbi:hypothetical protein HPB49_024839 [Dermacentor silvarum]|uniref:Uncharacterized protein n=1 Tax=Dermacentor silvarum TaxID=543639 RepID=A0ACB8CCB9_DERSI|nr:hypothetical protein HPB49_024839 [Dermacentor silvarum]